MLRARIENQNGRVIEGGRIRLSCNGTGYPRPTISWEKSGRVLVTGGNVFLSSDGELTIRDATSSMPDDKCEDKTSLMKCRLIVSARLCGYTMYSKICCASCMRYYEGSSNMAYPAIVLKETHNASTVSLVLVARVTQLNRETITPLKVILEHTDKMMMQDQLKRNRGIKINRRVTELERSTNEKQRD
ncbi:hypothetical protein MAR_000725 [Mya arenaria]|uniref:Ig-like domain-containing protein n=1 Tax=Mya arenaria TaxID=6604 RepID=A0ABY7FBA7_MYAAR|nr:hypothetical protein MAR_000725 [Mya arenaria]